MDQNKTIYFPELTGILHDDYYTGGENSPPVIYVQNDVYKSEDFFNVMGEENSYFNCFMESKEFRTNFKSDPFTVRPNPQALGILTNVSIKANIGE